MTIQRGRDMDDSKQVAGQLRWVHVLQGATMLLLGLVALFWPGLTVVSLLYVLVAYALIVGIIDVVVAVTSMNTNKNWWLNGIVGIAMVAIAAFLIRNPDVARDLFVVLVGVLFIVRGVFDVVIATMGAETSGDRSMGVAIGFLAVLTGIIIWIYPATIALGFVWVLGLFAVISGTASIARAVRASNASRIAENDQ